MTWDLLEKVIPLRSGASIVTNSPFRWQRATCSRQRERLNNSPYRNLHLAPELFVSVRTSEYGKPLLFLQAKYPSFRVDEYIAARIRVIWMSAISPERFRSRKPPAPGSHRSDYLLYSLRRGSNQRNRNLSTLAQHHPLRSRCRLLRKPGAFS